MTVLVDLSGLVVPLLSQPPLVTPYPLIPQPLRCLAFRCVRFNWIGHFFLRTSFVAHHKKKGTTSDAAVEPRRNLKRRSLNQTLISKQAMCSARSTAKSKASSTLDPAADADFITTCD